MHHQRKINNIPYICFALGIVFCFISCEQGVVLEENLRIEDAKWHRSEKAYFEFEIDDSSAVYEIYINFRHGGEYPYKNIYLFTNTKSPSGKLAKDTANMLLANNKGRWLGKGIGDLFDYEFKYKDGYLFPETGTYSFEIEQAMRDVVVEGTTDIGIKIKKVNL